MSNFKKYLEISFFVFINLLFTSNPLAMFFIMAISSPLSLYVFHANPVYENDLPFIVLCFMFGMLFIILKFILFPILYKFEKQFPCIHKFFNIIFSTKRNTLLTFTSLLGLLMADVLIYKLAAQETNWDFVSVEAFGLGLIPSYLVMLIYVKLKNRKKLKKS